MGEHAECVQRAIRERLAARRPGWDWETERYVAGTPVDVAGRATRHPDEAPATDAPPLVLVELEWRRADPADNAAKLFRHLASGSVDADRVVVCQAFTGYYDLERGGVSSKRKNAEFVGEVAAEAVEALLYRPLELDVDPPKRGGDLPDGWETAVEAVVEEIVATL